MEKINIDKNIPTPQKGIRDGKPKYPFRELEVGDSFYVDKPANKFSGSVTWARMKFPDRKFITRSEGNGTRVFRVA